MPRSRLAERGDGRAATMRDGSHAKKFHDMADFGKPVRAKLLFHGLDGEPQFVGEFRIELYDLIGALANDVIAGRLAQIDFVQRGPVVKKGPSHESDLIEGRHAAVDGDEIAILGPHVLVNLFDARRLHPFAQGRKNGEPRLRDA